MFKTDKARVTFYLSSIVVFIIAFSLGLWGSAIDTILRVFVVLVVLGSIEILITMFRGKKQCSMLAMLFVYSGMVVCITKLIVSTL